MTPDIDNSNRIRATIMSHVNLDGFLDALEDEEMRGSGEGGAQGIADIAYSSGTAAAAARSPSRRISSSSSDGGGWQKPSSSPLSSSSSSYSAGKKKGKAGGTFAEKLHDMLNQSQQMSNGIIEWRQDGTCFKILDRDRLASELLPIYFVSTTNVVTCIFHLHSSIFCIRFDSSPSSYISTLLHTIPCPSLHCTTQDHSNYTSFSRQLNGWNFKRIKKEKKKKGDSAGSSEGCYYHENFHRDRPEVASQMTRKPTPSDAKSASGKGYAAVAAAVRPQGVPSAVDQTVSSGGTEFVGSGTAQPTSQACKPVTGGSVPLPKRATFPVKLHAILSRSDLSNIISWREDGAAFIVHHPKAFASNVLPCYFDHNNYSSFLRKGRGWGFRRIKSGPDTGSYYHQLFHRDQPHLALQLKRQMAGSSSGGVGSVGHSRASDTIAAHRRGKTKKQSQMDAEFSDPSPSYSSGSAPAAFTGPAPSTSAGFDTVMQSLIHMQKVLNEQQGVLSQQILEVSNAAAAAAAAEAGALDPEAVFNSVSNIASSHELAMLETELNKFSADSEPALVTARMRCPNITDNSTLRLLFLWCTDFDVAATAKRMAGYWRLRVELFGVERAFLPLSSDSILNPEERAYILSGACRILPNTDTNGRILSYINQRKLHGSSFDPMSASRAVWYMFHKILMLDPERAKNGIVGIANYRDSSWSPNYSWMTLMSNTFKFLPIEIQGVHTCHAGMFARVIAPLTNLVIGPWIRKSSFTLHAHEGQDAAVLSSLARFGIPANCVPAELGGEIQ